MDLSAPVGVSQPKVYGDKSDEHEILNLPTEHLHAAIEQELIRRASVFNTRIAIVSFPMLYGKGNGLFATHAGHFRVYVLAVLERGRAFIVGNGGNRISISHVSSALSTLAFVVEEVLKGESSRLWWGREGYYIVESSEASFKDIAVEVARVLQQKGLIAVTEMESLDSETASQIWSPGPLVWGLDARARAEKLKELGWLHSGPSLSQSIESAIDSVLATVYSQS